jgi:hypothetical protein
MLFNTNGKINLVTETLRLQRHLVKQARIGRSSRGKSAGSKEMKPCNDSYYLKRENISMSACKFHK